MHKSKTDLTGCHVSSEVFWRVDGSSFDVEYSSFPVIDQGTINGAVVTFKDITDRKSKENTIKRALDEKNILLAEIHHRVKNNLAVVSAMLQLQSDDELNSEVADKLLSNPNQDYCQYS
ncbi:MAG: histidine kinase dimerization/phosphoacceptor domain -containing protein [Balneolales bacterium]